MKSYKVFTYTKEFGELVHGVIADALHDYQVTVGKDQTHNAAFYKTAQADTRDIFGRHWIGADRKAIPNDIYELQADETIVQTDVFEKSDLHPNIEIPIVLWEGETMSIMDIPNLAYAEEMCAPKAPDQMYYTPASSIKKVNANGMESALSRVLGHILKGDKPDTIIPGMEDPANDL